MASLQQATVDASQANQSIWSPYCLSDVSFRYGTGAPMGLIMSAAVWINKKQATLIRMKVILKEE